MPRRSTARHWGFGIGVLLMLSQFGQAQGAIVTFNLDVEFSGATPPAGSTPWIVATFDDGGSPGSVTLTMSATNLVGTEFIDDWLFNFDPALDLSLLSFSYDGGSTGPAANSVNTGVDAFQADGDGKFDIEFDFPPPPGDFSAKFTAGEVVIYDITSTESIVASSFDFASAPGGGNGTIDSAAHIQSIGSSGSDSGWIGPGDGGQEVPEPGSLAAWSLLGMLSITFGWGRGKMVA